MTHDGEMSVSENAKAETVEIPTIEYRTKDLNQAAFVWSQPTARLVELQGSSDRGTTIHFKFELQMPQDALRRLIFAYTNGETSVEPQAFVAKQNNLRDLLHSSLARSKKPQGKK